MITTADIACIVYALCEPLGVERVAMGQTLTGPLTGERCVIHVKEQQAGKYWLKSFVEVNLCVPDLGPLYTEADTRRLAELMRLALTTLDSQTGVMDGTAWRVSVYSSGIETDTTLRCHYANVRLAFQAQNVK